MRHYCLGGCSALSVCARRSRPVRGAPAGTWCCVSLVFPIPPRVSRAACGGPSGPGVPYPRSLVRHSTRSVRSAKLGPVALLVVPACPLRVCALALPRRLLPPPPWVVWRAHLARSRHWALLGPLHVVCAPPRVLPWSSASSGVLRGGRSGPGSPLPGSGVLLRGAAEVRRSPSPDCPHTGRAVGVRYPRAVGAAVWVWGPNTVPLACMPCGGCVPRGWCQGGGVPGGGGVACHCCEGRLVSGAVPPPTARPLGRAAGVPRPVCSECGRCGRGDPAPVPQRAPLRAGVARCGGGGRASPGGVPSTVVRGVWGQVLPLPRLPAHWAGRWGPPPTCCGRGCVGVGALHCPIGLHALWGLRAVGVVGGRPRGGWPATVVRGVWCQALSPPRPPVLWGGRPGFREPCVPGAVGAGMGTQHRFHSVRPCGPALLAVGVAEGRPRVGCLPPL